MSQQIYLLTIRLLSTTQRRTMCIRTKRKCCLTLCPFSLFFFFDKDEQKRSPTRWRKVKSVRRSSLSPGSSLQLMLRIHAALRRIQTVLLLGLKKSLFSGSTQGLYTCRKLRERERGRSGGGGRMVEGGATVLSVSFVAIGPPP